MTKNTRKSMVVQCGCKDHAAQPVNTRRIIADFGRDFFYDEAAQTITAVKDLSICYDFVKASSIHYALEHGDVEALEIMWKDKEIPFKNFLSDEPGRNVHNDELNFKTFGFTNCRKCGSALYRKDTACGTCNSPTHLKTCDQEVLVC